MKDFPQLEVASPAAVHEFVRLYLDIGQCRYIHALLSEKLSQVNIEGLEDKNDALYQLTQRFKSHAYPEESKPYHKNESFDDYIDNADTDSLNALLSEIYVEGVLHVE